MATCRRNGTESRPLANRIAEKDAANDAWLAFGKANPWFKMFAMNLSQIYDADEENPVETTITGAETGNG